MDCEIRSSLGVVLGLKKYVFIALVEGGVCVSLIGGKVLIFTLIHINSKDASYQVLTLVTWGEWAYSDTLAPLLWVFAVFFKMITATCYKTIFLKTFALWFRSRGIFENLKCVGGKNRDFSFVILGYISKGVFIIEKLSEIKWYKKKGRLCFLICLFFEPNVNIIYINSYKYICEKVT